jgi:2-iminobutanoate/2-iminopropanoate deaminase
MKKTVFRPPLAPPAAGPYSHAVRAGNLVFTAGQIALDPSTGTVIPEKDIRSQTRRTLLNLQNVLSGAGTSLSNVVRTTVFLKNMNDFAEMNAAYGEFFTSEPPARSTVEVARLPKDVLIEIDCIAIVNDGRD